MKQKHIIFSSNLIKKIIFYMLLIEAASLIIILSVCYIFLWPKLRATALNDSLVRQEEISSQVENYISNLTDASSFVLSSRTLEDVLIDYSQTQSEKNYNTVCLTLHELCSTMSNLRSVIVLSENGDVFDSIVQLKDNDWEYYSRHAGELWDSSTQTAFSSIYPLDTSPQSYGLCYAVQTHIYHQDYIFYFYFNVNTIITTCQSLSQDVFDSYCLVFPNMTVAASDMTIPSEFPDELFSGNYLQERHGIFFSHRIPVLNWYFIAYSSNGTINQAIYDIFAMVVIFCVIFFLLTLLMLTPMISHMIAPIYKLNAIMQKVSKENMFVYSDIQTKDEIGDLSNVFNQMLNSIQTHVQWQIEHEKKECQIRYNLLIAQIDSHFICNTMSIINSMARRGRTDDIIKVNTALIKILQNCLRVKTYKITDTIFQELDILNQYMIIEKMRYENHAQLIIDVPNELMNTEIPKNILQPVVENSFRHGLLQKDTGEISGTVLLHITYDDQSLYITISDNGTGASPEILQLLNSPDDFRHLTGERGKHIGLKNIYDRLRFIYGPDHTSIVFTSDHGFQTKITIPLQPEEYSLEEGAI